MSFVPSSLFEVVLRSTYRGISQANVFHYGNKPPDAVFVQDIYYVASNFKTTVLDFVKPFVSSQCQFLSIDVTQLIGGVGLVSYTLPPNTTGLTNGEALPAFNVYSFKSQRRSRDVKSAHKRFGPITEGAVGNGAVNDTGVLTALNVLASQLGVNLSDAGNVNSTGLRPFAISRTLNGQLRPFEIAELADDWSFTGISSQVSRK